MSEKILTHREIAKQTCISPAGTQCRCHDAALTSGKRTARQRLGRAPHLYDELGERLGDHFEQLGRLLAGLQAEAGDQQLRRPGHEAAGRLQGQQHQHRQPVEAVVDGGAGKGPAAAGTKG